MKPIIAYCFLSISLMEIVEAAPFGTFDPRSLAMGGTGVASANSKHAVFYNPALLALYDIYEDESRDSIFLLPVISARVSESLEEIADFEQQDFDASLSDAIADFNATNGSLQSAHAVLDASQNLQDGLSRIANGSVFVDANVAFTIAIPSLRQGGAFVFSKRAVGDGRVFKTPEDEALLNAYIETMQFLVTGEGVPNTDIIDNNNQLIDQTDNLNSSASAAGILVTELGVSMAHEFTVFNQKLALGIIPKLINVETYATASNVNNKMEDNRDFTNDWGFTADIGLAKEFENLWKVGFAVKNVVPSSYATNINSEIKLKPQLRAGVAYQPYWGTISFDMDVLENNAIGSGDPSQFTALGIEWDLKWGKLRGGYNYNFSATGPTKKGLFSAGIEFSPFGMILDLAYAENGVERAAALQTGFNF